MQEMCCVVCKIQATEWTMSLPLLPHWWELSHMASPSCKGGWEMSNWAVMFLATVLYLFFKNNFTDLFFGCPGSSLLCTGFL